MSKDQIDLDMGTPCPEDHRMLTRRLFRTWSDVILRMHVAPLPSGVAWNQDKQGPTVAYLGTVDIL